MLSCVTVRAQKIALCCFIALTGNTSCSRPNPELFGAGITMMELKRAHTCVETASYTSAACFINKLCSYYSGPAFHTSCHTDLAPQPSVRVFMVNHSTMDFTLFDFHWVSLSSYPSAIGRSDGS